MGVIPLTSSNVSLDVPSVLSATAYAGYIDVTWTHGLDDTEIKQLHSFILYYSDSTIAVFDPNVDSLPGGVTRLELTKSPGHIFTDTTYIKKYFKATSMNLSGVESALSSEVSATATQPPSARGERKAGPANYRDGWKRWESGRWVQPSHFGADFGFSWGCWSNEAPVPNWRP